MSETAPPLIQLVGIVNLSEQSFNQLGRFSEPSAAVDYIGKLLSPGVADKIDIGGEATNPNVSGEAAVDDEWGRLEPILRQVLPDYPDFSFSIDTRHPEIISRVVEVARGKLFYANDVTTFINPNMIKVVAANGLGAICSHMPLIAEGDVQFAHTLQMNNPHQIREELLRQVELMVEGGIDEKEIILDPGIGFGKTMPENWELLKFGELIPGRPWMAGYSRKRFLATDPENGWPKIPRVDRDSSEVNLAAARIAIRTAQQYSNLLYLRVHNVPGHRQLLNGLAEAA